MEMELFKEAKIVMIKIQIMAMDAQMLVKSKVGIHALVLHHHVENLRLHL